MLTGLGYGDEGKGTTTDYLCRVTGAHTVVRTGGPQAFHAVVTTSGQEHTFAQFGSGTLAGAKTHLSREMVIDPYAIMNEGRALIDAGVCDAFSRLSIDENAVAITPFQKAASRLREIARGSRPDGTVGIGVGEAVIDGETIGDNAIRVKDCGKPWLHEKLEAIRVRKLRELAPIIADASLPEKAAKEVAVLNSQDVVDWATQEFNFMARVVDIVDSSFLAEILDQEGTVVFEPSQGMLLDRWHGFHPHTTMARPDPGAANGLLREVGYIGEITRLGLVRAYQTRHGYGPFVTESDELTRLLPDKHNTAHEWQGGFRVGQFDALATRYAIEACGGPNAFDGLSVICLDRLSRLPLWQICDSYSMGDTGAATEKLVTQNGVATDIRLRPNSRDAEQLQYLQGLGDLLRLCHPNFVGFKPDGDSDRDYDSFLAMMEERLGISVAIASFGPTAGDKKSRRPI